MGKGASKNKLPARVGKMCTPRLEGDEGCWSQSWLPYLSFLACFLFLLLFATLTADTISSHLIASHSLL